MLSARVTGLLTVPLVGCGGSGTDAGAEDSLEHLGGRERDAARVLVELEQASRGEDTARLCRHVYAYPGPYEECRRALGHLLGRQGTMAIEVSDLNVRSGCSAIARAKVTIVDDDGERRTDRYTYRLVVRDGAWKVDFQT